MGGHMTVKGSERSWNVPTIRSERLSSSQLVSASLSSCICLSLPCLLDCTHTLPFCSLPLLFPCPAEIHMFLSVTTYWSKAARYNGNEKRMEHFSTHLILAPAHEVLAKDSLWRSLQELSNSVSPNNPKSIAGVGLVLGVNSREEPYIECVVENSPAMRSVTLCRLVYACDEQRFDCLVSRRIHGILISCYPQLMLKYSSAIH
jgi:hypothetical protein